MYSASTPAKVLSLMLLRGLWSLALDCTDRALELHRVLRGLTVLILRGNLAEAYIAKEVIHMGNFPGGYGYFKEDSLSAEKDIKVDVPDFKTVIYIIAPVEGSESLSASLAHTKLDLFCRDLDQRGYSQDITFADEKQFQFPNPSILNSKEFFGNPEESGAIAREMVALLSSREFAEKLHTYQHLSKRYFLARVRVRTSGSLFGMPILGHVREWREPFGLEYCVLPLH